MAGDTSKGKSVQQARPPITPPRSWSAHSPFGLLRFKEGNAGRLVLLTSVVRWLMTSRELPLNRAVDVVCDALDGGVVSHLYFPNEAGYAQRIGPSGFDRFVMTTEELALPYSQGHVRFWARTFRDGCLAPAPDEWRGSGFDFFEEKGPGTGLSVTFEKAHELWGWGAAVLQLVKSPFPLEDWPALVAYRKENRRALWRTGNQYEIVLAVYRKRGEKESNVAEEMGKELDISRQRMDEIIEDARDFLRASPLPKANADAKRA
ncbi:MAG: hypothetical protein LBI48_01305 [Burkholderiaceae bacterium]|jgi:hypothetical protein|nr:hypothetical protein [Burkholderiaceae bacterium]